MPGGRARESSSSSQGSPDAGGDDLLREDVERTGRHRRPVEDEPRMHAGAAAPSTSSSSVSGKSRPFGIFLRACPARPTRWRNVAIERVAPTWIDEVHVADVDAELERRRRDESPQRSRLQPLLGVQAARLREAAVVARDGLLAEQPRELRRDALGHLARVHEDERRPVLADELADALVDLLPLLVRADRRERRRRDLDRRGRARGTCPRRRGCTRGPRPPGSGRPRRAASAWPRGRRAGSAGPRAARGARARARGGFRACRGARAWISSTIDRRHRAEHLRARLRSSSSM